MEIIIILITTILSLVMLIIGIYDSIKYDNSSINVISFFLCIFILIILIATLSLKEKPKAIDVYRGKTTLEISYKDGIAVYSTVVFKNK